MGKEEIGILVKKRRKELCITKKDLALKVGVTTRAITHWEAGTREISLQNAFKLFKALKIELKLEIIKAR